MRKIKSQKIKDCCVTVPGSKSYTHRLYITAALSNGKCTICGALKSEDTQLTLNALQQMGVKINILDDATVIYGTCGNLQATEQPLYLGNSGTSMRLLAGTAAIGKGEYILTGTERMMQRPIDDLIASLNAIDVKAHCVNHNGCPPMVIAGGAVKGGSTSVNCLVSSQFLSALLLMAPYAQNGLEITVTHGPVSKPYIDMTVDIMHKLGVEVQRDHPKEYNQFKIAGGQCYQAGEYFVEPDCSQAGYFWAAAAITGAAVKVNAIPNDTHQGDLGLTKLFEQMGCKVIREKDGITVAGRPLTGITADMSDMPDMVPTLAIVASFAKGVTVIKNVAHLKAKESDRLTATVNELTKMGVKASCSDDGMIIHGGNPVGAEIETYNDHRIAMSFAVAGLKTPGVIIKDEICVAKSFPNFWDVWETLY
ncbi:3-phosphoshikimate 1-carboxyvinyltransferase [Desulfococcaceae bacterium HSG7]|nr:3-phosphoshikimate 1-carboxyvinyltransferase [Desulfococcaceae bacterium HSG7]